MTGWCSCSVTQLGWGRAGSDAASRYLGPTPSAPAALPVRRPGLSLPSTALALLGAALVLGRGRETWWTSECQRALGKRQVSYPSPARAGSSVSSEHARHGLQHHGQGLWHLRSTSQHFAPATTRLFEGTWAADLFTWAADLFSPAPFNYCKNRRPSTTVLRLESHE